MKWSGGRRREERTRLGAGPGVEWTGGGVRGGDERRGEHATKEMHITHIASMTVLIVNCRPTDIKRMLIFMHCLHACVPV